MVLSEKALKSDLQMRWLTMRSKMRISGGKIRMCLIKLKMRSRVKSRQRKDPLMTKRNTPKTYWNDYKTPG